jgi:hypothetical protein
VGFILFECGGYWDGNPAGWDWRNLVWILADEDCKAKNSGLDRKVRSEIGIKGVMRTINRNN